MDILITGQHNNDLESKEHSFFIEPYRTAPIKTHSVGYMYKLKFSSNHMKKYS